MSDKRQFHEGLLLLPCQCTVDALGFSMTNPKGGGEQLRITRGSGLHSKSPSPEAAAYLERP